MLAHHGAEPYHSFTHGVGFFRNFFAALKGGTDRSGRGIERLFITGVSPVTMDDVTSDFNIGTNVSLEPDFNEMVGFTEAEVRGLVETYREDGVFNQDVDTAMSTRSGLRSGRPRWYPTAAARRNAVGVAGADGRGGLSTESRVK